VCQPFGPHSEHVASADAALWDALLLLGPTGSGKTPLGVMLEARGWHGRPCTHFDFGAILRAIVRRDRPDELLTRRDLDFLAEVLRRGTLLEDEHFPLAERILRGFLCDRKVDRSTMVVLNGLPRHVGQARALEALMRVRAVVFLHARAETVWKRIQANIGGERTGRDDDDPPSIEAKLALFAERTAPLLDYYRQRHVPVLRKEVEASTTAEELWQWLHEFAA